MKKSCLISLLFLFILELISATTAVAVQNIDIYYFNPDSPQNNPSRLKRDMEVFLAHTGIPVTFQPFTHLVDLESRLREAPPAFSIVPYWYLRKYGEQFNLQPLLVPVRQGKSSYRKILLGAKNTNMNFGGTAHPTVAMTSMGPDGEGMLNTIVFTLRAPIRKYSWCIERFFRRHCYNPITVASYSFAACASICKKLC